MDQEQGSAPYQARHPKAFRLAKATGKAVFLRRERRPGWSAALPLYVLWCDDCRVHTVTHPAGYGRIRCRRCRHSVRVMTWARFRDKVFTRELAYGLVIALWTIAALLGFRVI